MKITYVSYVMNYTHPICRLKLLTNTMTASNDTVCTYALIVLFNKFYKLLNGIEPLFEFIKEIYSLISKVSYASNYQLLFTYLINFKQYSSNWMLFFEYILNYARFLTDSITVMGEMLFKTCLNGFSGLSHVRKMK